MTYPPFTRRSVLTTAALGLTTALAAPHIESASAGTTSAKGFQLIHQSKHWNVWAKASYYSANQSSFTPAALNWLEKFLPQLIKDFGFSVFPLSRGQSQDAIRMDCVLDPQAQGGAHTGTVFGGIGLSVSPDAIVNPGQFYWYIFTMHESVNVFTGSIASDWIWADGSNMWKGGSPFPNMCDIQVSAEVGNHSLSSQQFAREGNYRDVALFMYIQKTHGWKPYKDLFAFVKSKAIDWSKYQEPLRTAVTCWLLSQFSGEDLLSRFNNATKAISGRTVDSKTYARAQKLFPDPRMHLGR
jgi:hypothetical protein